MTTKPTVRQLQILEMSSRGMTAGEVAAELYLTDSTVRTHLKKLFRIIGARNVAHALRIAHLDGLLDLSQPVERLTIDAKRTTPAQDERHEQARKAVPAELYEKYPSLQWGVGEWREGINNEHIVKLADSITRLDERAERKTQ